MRLACAPLGDALESATYYARGVECDISMTAGDASLRYSGFACSDLAPKGPKAGSEIVFDGKGSLMPLRAMVINGRTVEVQVPDAMPLLWVLRDVVGLTGTKYGCGEGICGSCTVLEDGQAVRSCLIPAEATEGKRYTTIEGLSADGSHPIQQAWLDEDVSQCGYCQPGMMLELRSLLRQKPKATADDIDDALSDHVCRCGSYPRIRKAALAAVKMGGGR